MRRKRSGCFLRFVFLLLLLVAGAGLFLYLSLNRPYRGFQNEAFVEIPKGTSTRKLAQQLKEAGVVQYPWQFLVARIVQPDATLQAGEYRFEQPASVWKVFDRIRRGDIYFYEVVVPEGNNMFDIAASLGATKLIDAKAFLHAASSPKLIQDLDPKAPSLEGYLFPSKYRLTRHTTAEQLCRLMTEQFRKTWAQLMPASGTSANVHDVVTLASLIEKETALPSERPMIASVFRNRLAKGMKLDCDPTTIYAALLEGHYRGKIHRSDLDNRNAYNTYHHAGLPPGPIANPGEQSLKAAVAPADSKSLYFVAKGDGSGGHRFSADLAEHGLAVQEYRRAQKEVKAR